MGDSAAELRLIARFGAALLGANAPTTAVDRSVTLLAERFDVAVDVVVAPSEVVVVRRADGRTELKRAKPGSYRFDQTAALFDLVDEMLEGTIGGVEATRRLDDLERSAPLVGIGTRYVGYLLLIIGLSLNQQPAVAELLATAAIGIIVALVFVTTPRWGMLSLLAPVVAAFVSTVGIAAAVRLDVVTEPNKVIIPLLASLVPGAALTIGSLELTRGAIVAGASRLAMAVHQLLVLALGVVIGISLFSVTSDLGTPDQLLSWWFRPLGVLLYAAGVWLAFAAPRRALPSLVLVLVGAWAVQQVALLGLSAYTAGFLAGVAGVLIALAVRVLFGGAPTLLTLNPIYRIIAPGGLGLVTVVKATSGDEWLGPDLGTVVFHFMSVAIGMAVAFAIAESVATRRKQEAA